MAESRHPAAAAYALFVRPVVVGNSCGGDILHTLGARNPDRIGGLMYLDATEDPTLTMADYDLPPVDTAHWPARVPVSIPVVFPEAEIRQRDQHPLDPVHCPSA